jgi:hypothetical protein
MGKSNGATSQVAPGCDKFTAFCVGAEVDHAEEQDNPITVESTQLVSNGDERNSNVDTGLDGLDETDWYKPV